MFIDLGAIRIQNIGITKVKYTGQTLTCTIVTNDGDKECTGILAFNTEGTDILKKAFTRK